MKIEMSARTAWVLLLGMVLVEVFSTMMLKQSDGFTHLLPAGIALLGYGVVLYLFSFILAVIPASLAYAVWAGLGTLLVIVAGWIWFGEGLTIKGLLGVGLIVVGVILINRPESPAA